MNILRSATGKRWLGADCSHGREARSAKRFVLTQCYENRVLTILNQCLEKLVNQNYIRAN